MKKWIKTSGIIAAIAAVSVISFAAVSFAQAPTPTETPNLIQQFRNGIQDRFGGRGGHDRGDKNFGQLPAETQSAVAAALNMSVADLQAAIDGGQTLTEIATAQGVDIATVQTALNAARTDAMKAQLADKVAAGDLTQEEADAMLQRMESGDLFDKGGRGDFGGQWNGPAGKRGGPNDGFGAESFSQLPAETQSAVATALNMSVEELQAAIDGGQTLTEIATAQGVDLATVQTALNAARLDAMKTQLADKVAAGEITQEQADAMLQRMESGDLLGKGGRGDFDGQERGIRDFSQIPADTQAALAAALNMSVDELQAAIDGGQTLAQIAETQGVDMATVQTTLNTVRLAELKTQLDAKVAAGTITQEQADAILEQAQSGNFSGRDGRQGHPGGRGGRGFPGGSAPDDSTAPSGTAPDGTNFQAPATSGGSNL